MYHSKIYAITQEVIAAQPKNKTKDIAEITNQMWQDVVVSKTNPETTLNKYSKALSKATMDAFGLNISYVHDSFTPAAIISGVITAYNPLLRKQLTPDSEFIKELTATNIASLRRERKGTIDLNNAMVGGMYSKVRHVVYMSLELLLDVYKLTKDELTAFILHEVGHAFTYTEANSRISRDNLVLADLAEQGKSDKRRGVLVTLQDPSDPVLTDDEVDDLVNNANDMVFNLATSKLLYSRIQSLMVGDGYNESTAEQQADHFATKLGYGLQLTTALHKLRESDEDIQYVPVYGIVGGVLLLIYSVAGLITMLGFLLPYILLALAMLAMNSPNGRYDNDKDRHERIRQTYIGLLMRHNDMSKEDKKAILADIKAIGEIVDKSDQVDGNGFSRFINFLSSGGIDNTISKQQQRRLEKFAFNNIHVVAAQLSLEID